MDGSSLSESLVSYNLTSWLALKPDKQEAEAVRLAHFLGPSYRTLFVRSYTDDTRCRIPTFLHLATGLEFNLIPGGTFSMGLSPAEEKYLLSGAAAEDFAPDVDRMKPVHQVRVDPYLMAWHPCTKDFVQRHNALDQENAVTSLDDIAAEEAAPVTIEHAFALAENFGFDLPSEAQWEYACRGKTQTPFYFGSALPSDDVLEKNVLLRDFSNREVCTQSANAFGLVGLQVGEWCADTYSVNYDQASSDDLPTVGGLPHVVRGGAALSWPWQGCGEWQFCLSANRLRSDMFHDIVEEDVWAVRFVKRLSI